MHPRLLAGLRVRFGLPELPDDADIARWVSLTDERTAHGMEEVAAAEAAAEDAFRDLHGIRLYSHMDTIAWLLAEARAHTIAIQETDDGTDRRETADQIRLGEPANG